MYHFFDVLPTTKGIRMTGQDQHASKTVVNNNSAKGRGNSPARFVGAPVDRNRICDLEQTCDMQQAHATCTSRGNINARKGRQDRERETNVPT